MTINEVLHKMQKGLKVPKEQDNTFGKYKFRSCEDIVEAVKKVIPEGYTLTLNDEIVMIGDRYYVKATAMLCGDGDQVGINAFARESLTKKGMDDAQITGTASSYARKYALNGLFAIDDTKDSDTNEHKNESDEAERSAIEDYRKQKDGFKKDISDCVDLVKLNDLWREARKDGVLTGGHRASMYSLYTEVYESLQGQDDTDISPLLSVTKEQDALLQQFNNA